MKFVLLYSALVANILTNIFFKLSALNDLIPVKKWGYLGIGLTFGLINSILFTESLKYVNFGEASAVFFALTVIGLYGSSYFIFHEPVNSIGLVGVVLITAGVIIISYSMNKVKGV